MNISPRIQGALGAGVGMAIVTNLAYHTSGIEVPPNMSVGFFACPAIPTALFARG